MNILHKVTWQAMWKNRVRTIVTVAGIVLSAAMFTAVTTMGISIWDFVVKGEVYDEGDWFVQFDYTDDAEAEALRSNEDVSRLSDYQALGFLKTQEDSDGPLSTFVLAAGDQNFFDTMPVHVEAGRLPQNSSEIALPACILDILNYYGMGTQLGDTITMELITDYQNYPEGIKPVVAARTFSKTYTVVGHITEDVYNDYNFLYSMFTFADGNQGTPIWHRLFVQCAPGDALALSELPLGFRQSIHTELLGLYGVTQYANYNMVIGGLCAVLCCIIMLGSVSLIYNAFSISVSERTRQFGLLSSVGATRKQLRGTVYYEALTLCAIGIPLGLAAGYGGMAVTMELLGSRIDRFFALGAGTIRLRAQLSPAALLAATLIALLTVCISAAVPARRATRVSPLEAIRQKSDYMAGKKEVRVGKLTQRLFGLPGLLSRKYYKISRKKYRATVLSLTASIVLFISAACFNQTLQATVALTISTENYDIIASGDALQNEKLREQPFVTRAAYMNSQHLLAWVPDEQLSEEFLASWEQIHAAYTFLDKNMTSVQLAYLEDAVLEAYLRDAGIDPAPYLDAEDPLALVCAKQVAVRTYREESGEQNRFTLSYVPFRQDAQRLILLENQPPDALLEELEGNGPSTASYEYVTDETGTPYLVISPIVYVTDGIAGADPENAVTYRMERGTDAQVYYYRQDPLTGETEQEPSAVMEIAGPRFRLGVAVQELPFGVRSDSVTSPFQITLILPLSSAPADWQQNPNVCLNVSDQTAAAAYLAQNFEEYEYFDTQESEAHNRTLLLMINVFSYGFIILISLIAVANVFNTVSTNVALRRRDFGMLRSTGFRSRDIRRMLCYECVIYGCQALLWGLPVSLGISYGIYRLDSSLYATGYVPPWSAIAIAALSVFAVVFATMFYAVSKLRRDNPIDAIRMENL